MTDAAATATTATETATGGFDWKSSLGDAGAPYLETVTAKGWKSPADAIKSYTELESALGRDKIVVPGPQSKPEDWDRVYAKLGRPEKPEAYGLKPIEGMPEGVYDPKAAEWFAAEAHAAGLNPAQARRLHDGYVKRIVDGHNAKINGIRQAGEQGEQTLRQEWGQGYEQKVQLGQRAAKAIGLDAETVDKIEGAIGFAGLMKMFSTIGEKMGEDVAVGAGGGQANPRTPEGAMAEIQRIYADAAKDQAHPYLHPETPEGQALQKRMMELNAIAFPGMAA